MCDVVTPPAVPVRSRAAFDERLDKHGDEVAAQQRFDAGGIVEEHRRGELGALELGVAFLQVGLVLVGGQQLGAELAPAHVGLDAVDQDDVAVQVGRRGHDVGTERTGVSPAELEHGPTALDRLPVAAREDEPRLAEDRPPGRLDPPAPVHAQVAAKDRAVLEREQEVLANCLDALESTAVDPLRDSEERRPGMRRRRRDDLAFEDERGDVRAGLFEHRVVDAVEDVVAELLEQAAQGVGSDLVGKVTFGFVALRATNLYGDPAPWTVQEMPLSTVLSFVNCEKYPPSLLFLMMTLGPALMLLAAFEHAWGQLAGRLATFGQVPFFFYVAHIYLVHALAVATGFAMTGALASRPELGLSLAGVYLIWLLVLVLLYPLCRQFAELKQRRTEWWWPYL